MKIDLESGAPIYQQIVDNMKLAVLSGRYRDGDRVLPVRELAMELRINPNTVARAYRMMQEEGLLVSRPGGGNFITVPENFTLQRQRENALAEDLAKLIAKARLLEISPERLNELINMTWKQNQPEMEK